VAPRKKEKKREKEKKGQVAKVELGIKKRKKKCPSIIFEVFLYSVFFSE